MATHQIGTSSAPGYVDKRRSYKDEFESRVVTGPVIFTCNATGTTTTAVGALSTPGTNANVIRIGEEFKLFNTGTGTLKQETVFRVTNVVDAASRTLTFTPAALVAPVSGDTIRLVQSDDIDSTGNKDRRLVALGFTAARVQTMTENDKDYQLRTSDDPGSI
jgi:hypothetical protein